MPKKIQKMILYGNGGESINFTYVNDKGRKTTRNAPFEGVIHNMQRRYHETESQMVREELYVAIAALVAFVLSVKRGERIPMPQIAVPDALHFDTDGNLENTP